MHALAAFYSNRARLRRTSETGLREYISMTVTFTLLNVRFRVYYWSDVLSALSFHDGFYGFVIIGYTDLMRDLNDRLKKINRRL